MIGVYDAVLAFPQERKSIWKRKFSAVAILYLLLRYGTTVNLFLQVFNILYINESQSVSTLRPPLELLLTFQYF